jgi:hypothetical protein
MVCIGDNMIVGTATEIELMDDTTFLKAVKAKQLIEAREKEAVESARVTAITRDTELKTFDEETKLQLANLEASRSMARTDIEKKYIVQVATKEVEEIIL